jgi:hypothetical protein
MPENTNVNNNSSVVVVGRTAPVPTGQQSSDKSIPVVIASDQSAIPVEEQNKQQSEVALSLLGIPRSEVALGIFADVNTYDVNPTEWTATPVQLKTVLPADQIDYTGIPGQQDWGLSHVPSEAGAHIEAPAGEFAILTSKRFFRYQPGRVSAGTFGVKFGRAPYTVHKSTSDYPSGNNQEDWQLSEQTKQVAHPSVKKYGIFDKFDGYYYESINEGRGDNFSCVRRTQSLTQQKGPNFFTTGAFEYKIKQYDDYGNMQLKQMFPIRGDNTSGKNVNPAGNTVILRDGLVNIHAGLFDASLLKEKREIKISGSAAGEWIELDPIEVDVDSFAYNNATGRASCTTIGDHGLKEGDSITMRDLLMTCNTGTKSYPNKFAQTTFFVESKVGNTLNVFVGKSTFNSVFTQSYVANTGDISKLDQQNTGSTFNISSFEYASQAPGNLGVARITTTADHGLEEGDKVKIANVGLTNDAANTLGVTFPQTDRPDIYQVRRKLSERIFEIFPGKPAVSELSDETYDITDADYNPTSGALELTISGGVPTGITTSSWIKLKPESIWLTCDFNNDGNTSVKKYPRASGAATAGDTDPDTGIDYNGADYVYDREIQIQAFTATTITVNVSGTDYGQGAITDTTTHNFVADAAANAGAVRIVNHYATGGTATPVAPTYADPLSISGFNYNTTTGIVAITVSDASTISDGDRIKIANVQTSCSYGDKTYPAKDDEDVFPISNVTNNSFTFELEKSAISHTHQSKTGRVVHQGLRKGSSVYIYKSGNTVGSTGNNAIVDGGIYFVDDVLGKRVKLTRNPTNGLGGDTSVFTDIDPIVFTAQNYLDGANALDVTDASYNPTSGVLELTVGTGHGLTTADKIKLKENSLTFTCDFNSDGNTTLKTYPRAVNAGTANGADYVYNKEIPILATTTTTITINVNGGQGAVTDTTAHAWAGGTSTDAVIIVKKLPYLVTPAPFTLPNTTNGSYKGEPNGTDPDQIVQLNPYGAFPYKYSYGDALADKVGYITTDVAANTASGAETLKQGIDYVNSKLLSEWVYNHVKPEFWTVYEYRVPRSRFSGEKVDGQTSSGVLYSDVVYSNGVNRFPGEKVIDEATDSPTTRTSNWNLNPENVTMYKIEFSWYGAVGALFLAYVPLDSGEARWVRVHHLRASNQLKVASLGNPTLPITYYVYGGGTQYAYGYRNDLRYQNYIAGSSSRSEYLVKYGASYYIDGGDRGTVRLFNYATPTVADLYGNTLTATITAGNNEGAGTTQDPEPHIIIPATMPAANGLTVSSDLTFLMGATVLTPNREPGVKVSWVDTGNSKVYLNKTIDSSSSGTFKFVVDRPKILLGLKCREEINSVRNRVQVYPTRLSIGNSGSYATVKLLKSPVFQTQDTPSGSFTTTLTVGAALNIGSIGKPTEITGVNNATYLEAGQSTYGYFRGFYDGDSSNIITIFGLLQRSASGNYLFNAYEKTNINLLIYGDFLRAGEFYEPNPTSIDGGSFTPSDTPLTALSAISISTEQRTPIPGTGQQITTLFTPANSGEQFPLQQFFDYNKDYLSFPLTDDVETLFVVASQSSTYDSTSVATQITAAITWEEQ